MKILQESRSPLDIRCALARAAVLESIALTDQADDAQTSALEDALHLGYAAAQFEAAPEVPVMFQGTLLEPAFNDGVAEWHLHIEITNCHDCQISRGDPCPVHG